jgi:hypothetical protein
MMPLTRKYTITHLLGNLTFTKGGGVNIVLRAQTFALSGKIRACTCFTHASKM